MHLILKIRGFKSTNSIKFISSHLKVIKCQVLKFTKHHFAIHIFTWEDPISIWDQPKLAKSMIHLS